MNGTIPRRLKRFLPLWSRSDGAARNTALTEPALSAADDGAAAADLLKAGLLQLIKNYRSFFGEQTYAQCSKLCFLLPLARA